MLALLENTIFQIVLIGCALVAIAIPSVFVGVREATKLQRRRIVNDLSLIFEREDVAGAAAIPSFEFVKYKYSKSPGRVSNEGRRDFAWHHWLISGLPLALYVWVANVFVSLVVLHAAFKISLEGIVPWLDKEGILPLFAWVVMSSHIGGILFTLRAFKQAVNNFDLSPLSLVGAVVNLAFGPATALLLAFSLFKLPNSRGMDLHAETTLFPFVILTAFAAGYYPDIAMRQLMKLSKLRNYKRFDDNLYKEFKAIPIDIIDGIDGEIRSRLSDYHLNTVQNLATANPLMLFVETPYGVYEIMDWVAQAQLCSSVGPPALLKLWRIGIRTIFDLERVALDRGCIDDALIAQIGDILWATDEHDAARKGRASLGAGRAHPPLSAVKANIRMRIENPHALRLRQIFNQVSHSLGEGARRLPPVVGPSVHHFHRRSFHVRRTISRRAAPPVAAAAWALLAVLLFAIA